MKIVPEQLRWFNEQELKNWLEAKKDSCLSKNDKWLIQYLINHLNELYSVKHTIKIGVDIKKEAK